MKTFELIPNDSHKSFYGKAKIIQSNNISELQSYDTIVASYNHSTNEIKVNGWYSSTTARHINSFLEYYGFDPMTKKEMSSQK